MTDQRRNQELPRPTFAALARAAIERAVPETRGPDAYWSERINHAWVRWPLDGQYAYLHLHRHLDWITGEFGVASEPAPLERLTVLPGPPPPDAKGTRVRLGDLVGEADRWWRAGADQQALAERLEGMALELRVKGLAYFRRRSPGRRRPVGAR